MSDRKRSYELKVQGVTLRRLAPIQSQIKPENEADLAHLISLNPQQTDQKIDLLNRLIKHLKTL